MRRAAVSAGWLMAERLADQTPGWPCGRRRGRPDRVVETCDPAGFEIAVPVHRRCQPDIVWYLRLKQHRLWIGGVMAGQLTDRQLECLRLSATMTDKDIGRYLGISHHTANLHIREAMRRLEVSSRKAALRRIASEPLYGSEAITAPAHSGPDGPAPGDPAGDTEGTTGFKSGTWLLPPPPRRSLRPSLILVFAAVAALITVGLVNVVSGAVGTLAPLAPPTAILTQD